MRRTLAHTAKVRRCTNDALAKVILPDSIYHHTRGERVCLTSDRLSQLNSAAALSKRCGLAIAEDLQEAARSNLTKGFAIAPNGHFTSAGFGPSLTE